MSTKRIHTNPIEADDPLLTKQEIADLYGTTDRFVEKLIASGELPAYKLGGKLVRIRRSDALALCDRCAQCATRSDATRP